MVAISHTSLILFQRSAFIIYVVKAISTAMSLDCETWSVRKVQRIAKLASSQMVPSKCTYKVSCNNGIGIEAQEWNCYRMVSIPEVYTIFTHSPSSIQKFV